MRLSDEEKTHTRRRLILFLVVSALEIAVFVVALAWISNPIAKWLICIGAGGTAVSTLWSVALLSTRLGRYR